MPRIGVAIIGVGRIGQLHLGNIVRLVQFKIRWLVDVKSSHGHLEQLIAKYRLTNETKTGKTEDIDKVLADKNVKVVVICTPTGQHEEIIKKALRAGKDVFCEKPLALTLEAVTSCYAEAINLGRTLFCAFNRRFDPQFRQIYEEARAGKYGKLRMIKMTCRDPNDALQYLQSNKGGIFLDMGIHSVDYICWLIGEKPTSVTAYGSTSSEVAEGFKDLGESDTACAILSFPCGALAQIDLARASGHGYDETLEVFGTLKTAKTKNMLTSDVVVVDSDGSHTGKLTDSFLSSFAQSYMEEMTHFLNVIEGKEECLVSAESCITDMHISELLQKSLQTGEIVYINPMVKPK